MRVHGESLHKICGIYCIIHRESGRCYVGSSLDIGKRRTQHIYDIAKGSLNFFHNAVRELGIDSFDFELISICAKEELRECEKFFIEWYNSAENGFNTHADPTKVFGGAPTDRARAKMSHRRAQLNREWVRSPETRARMSAGIKKAATTPEGIARIARLAQEKRGVKHSEERRAKVRAATLARWADPMYKARVSETMRQHWADPNFRTKPRNKGDRKAPTGEARARMVEKLKARWEVRRLTPMSAEHRAKIGAAIKGRVTSEETKEKMRAAWHLRKNISAKVSKQPILSSEPKQV